jgi:CheY-like chemotaxis protein
MASINEDPTSFGQTAGSDLRVLVAEDNRVNQEVARRALESAHCWVDIAPDGAAAVRMFQDSCYDLILMDCSMPRLDGYGATAAIRDLERATGEHVPIVALTADAAAGNRDRCLTAGMDDFLPKPVRPAALRGLMSLWCGTILAEPEILRRAPSPRYSPVAAGRRLDSQIAEAFLGQAPGDLETIKQALADSDPVRLSRAAHRMKSSCAVVGSPNGESLCRALEVQGKSHDLQGAASLVASLELEMVALGSRLGRHLQVAA